LTDTASKHQQVESNLANELKKFQVLYELAIAMTADRSLFDALQLVVEKTRELLETDTAYVALRDLTRGAVYMHTLSGVRTEAFKNMRVPFGKGLGGLVAQNRRGYIVDDYQANRKIEHVVDSIVADEGLVSGMAVPLQMGDENIGVLYAFNRKQTRFTQNDLDTLFLIGNLAAIEIFRKRVDEALQSDQEELEMLVSQRTAKLVQTNQDLVQEIDERRRVEVALRESEQKYSNLTANLSIGVYRNTPGPTGRFVDANPALLNMFGYDDPQDLFKIAVSDLYQNPENRQVINAKLLQAGAIKNEEIQLKHRDGSEFTGSVSAIAIKDETGEIQYFDGFIQDISDRKKAEEALRESEEKYRLLVENAKDAIFVTQDNRIKFMNPTAYRFLGYSKDEMLKASFIDFIHPDDRERMFNRYVKRIKGEKLSDAISFRVLSKQGEEIHVNLNAVLITWEGEPAVLNFLRDITPQRKMEAQLQQAQKMEAIGTLAGGIAHNFNNMLMGIQGNISLMRMRLDPDSPLLEKLGKAENIVASATQMTRQLLGYAREGRYEAKPLDLNQLVKDSSEIFAVTRKEIKVHRNLTPDLSVIKADKSQIEQLLWNLFVNAADAMPAGGELFIRTDEVAHSDFGSHLFTVTSGTYIRLIISDTGVGMDPKTKAMIFEPFFTTKPIGKGTGLGLASVYGIIKAHGGYIDVESQEGQGTVFYIYLPTSQETIPQDEKPPTEAVEGSETILLVEDEEIVLEISQEILNVLGYHVLIARNGEEALQVYKAKQQPIDLVILDMVMPGMGGGETFDRLRELDPGLKVLLSSGYSLDGQAKEILHRGCNGFIQKPFDIKQLSQKIRELLESSDTC